MKTLRHLADARIASLTGVHATDNDSFRIGKKVFARLEFDNDVPIYCFKLPETDARRLCERHAHISPMRFGNMGAKGWVEFRLSRKQQLPTLERALNTSRDLF